MESDHQEEWSIFPAHILTWKENMQTQLPSDFS